MRVLHYILGLPPYRTGGLVKYTTDLMQAQAAAGDEVMCMWPGRIRKLAGKPTIKQVRTFNGVSNFEMINPLPVSLDEGIADICAYTRPTDIGIFRAFLEEKKPDILHIHTLMGMYAELVLAAKELGIKTVFTTHDYFGLCPKVTFFYKGHNCNLSESCGNCENCNASALSMNQIRLLQSPAYRVFKDSAPVKALRARHRGEFFVEEDERMDDSAPASEKYQGLRKFYLDILNKIDLIHCNSSVTESIYRRFLPKADMVVMPISHGNIQDNRKKRDFSDKIRLIFLAAPKQFKGFALLRDALDRLWEEGDRRFTLNMYCSTEIDRPYVVRHDTFAYSELPKVFDDGDVLVAPSVCYETFGFTILEALSYGIPVLVSDTVGGRDLVKNFGEVFESDSVSALYNTIKGLTAQKLSEYNSNILDNFEVKETYELARCVYERISH